MAATIRIVLVDDHPVVRAGLRSFLARRNGFDIVGESGSGLDALEVIGVVAPDVAVVDQGLNDMSAAALCREIAERKLRPSVVVLSAELDEAVAEAAFLAGARAYVVKDVDASELARAIETAARGETYLDPKVAGRAIAWAVRGTGPARSEA